MTKQDITNAVYEKIGGFSKKEATILVNEVIEVIVNSFEQQKNVKISGFGTFSVQNKKARIGRNPKTGKQTTIKPRNILSFKASRILRNLLND